MRHPRPARDALVALLRSRRGATVVEYGLIAALVVIAMLVALQALAGETVGMWNNVSTHVRKHG